MKKLIASFLLVIALTSSITVKQESQLIQPISLTHLDIALAKLPYKKMEIAINIQDKNGLCTNGDIITTDLYSNPDFDEYIDVVDSFNNHLPYKIIGNYDVKKYGGYNLEVVVIPPLGIVDEIKKSFLLAISEPLPNSPEVKINNIVNFDELFPYVKVENNARYADDGTDIVQNYVDDGVLTEYRKVFHHHNTKEMLTYVYACTEGSIVIINNKKYISKGISYTNDIRDDIDRVYDFNTYKITTCASHTEKCMCRWIVELIELD